MANVWDAMKKHQAEEAERERAMQAEIARSAETKTEELPVSKPAPTKSAAAKAGKAESLAVETAVETAPAPVAPVEPARKTGTVQAVLVRPAPPPTAKPKPPTRKHPKDASYSELLMAHHDRGGPVTEEYRALRTSLLAQNPDERFCYLITSANAGEGKTITAANLALVMAERIDRRTILVDCDLRKHMLARYLGAPNVPGMTELLHGQVTLKEAVQPTAYPNLFFVPAGQTPEAQVAEIVGRPDLEEIIAEIRRQYDYVIVDTPPINMVSDAGMIGQATGEALLVVRMHKTHRESVDKAIRLLHAANVKPAGIVLTHRRFIIPNYLYRYS